MSDSPFGPSPLSSYGTCLAEYQGQGELTLDSGTTVHCDFHAGQLANGQIFLLCDLPPEWLFYEGDAQLFVGWMSDGSCIRTQRRLRQVNYLARRSGEPASLCRLAFRVQELAVMPAKRRRARRVHFGITNLVFAGTQLQIEPDGSAHHVLPLRLAHPDGLRHVVIKPVANYFQAVRALRTLKYPQVTAEIVSDDDPVQLKRKESLVDDLCYLLSLARGTKIQWVYRYGYDRHGEIVSRRHVARVTKPYCPQPIIDPGFDARDDTHRFIELTYPTYVAKRDVYRLNCGLIDAYLDARLEQDYLEARGVKFAVVLEMIKDVFVTSPGSSVHDMILGGNPFKRIRRILKQNLCQQLGGLDVTDQLAQEMIDKLSELNRRPLRGILLDICQILGLRGLENDVARVIKLRDRLVHAGQFRKGQTTTKSNTRDYLYLVHFLDRLMLRLVDYDGPYIDWHRPNQPVRRLSVR